MLTIRIPITKSCLAGPGRGLAPLLWASALALVLVFICPLARAGDYRAAIVKYIVDGDTFVLNDNKVVRLVGIDTPEMGKNKRPDQYYALKAKGKLASLLKKGAKCRLVADKNDRYGRLLAVVFNPGGINLNREMVKTGHAFFYFHKGNDRDLNRQLVSDQRRAMAQGLGFWPKILSLAVSAKTWVGNRKTRRMFPVGCGHWNRISFHNKIVFKELEAGFFNGYAPARICSPWR